MATRSAFRKWFARLAEAFLVLVLLAGGGPFLLALALRWVDPPTTTVILSRPGRRNAIDLQTAEALSAATAEARR